MAEPKVGDVKKCEKCGEEQATYKRMPHEATREPKRPEQPGDRYAWSCAACGFEDRVPS